MYSIGTEEYIRRVVEDYSPMLLRLAMTRSLSTADAEDAVQEVFLRLLTQLPRFRDGEHERAWLIRTTIHRASDLRKAASNRTLPLEEAEVVAMPEEAESSPILSAVQALPEKYSTVIHLYYYEGYTIKEIAKLLGLPTPTVGTRLSRGREKLRKLLEEEVL
ncbi:MAG: RNA polymerase sigma factor [Ruminiclostridium sp.]|jgi:RNA polymerase sigma factor (sigma-70 family)|nr:RNA polymerase sigma factor [Ruminiclostridium sp.]